MSIIALPTRRSIFSPARWASSHCPIPDRASQAPLTPNSAAARTVLDVLRVAFADELEGQCIPDDQLITWLHNNDGTRATGPS